MILALLNLLLAAHAASSPVSMNAELNKQLMATLMLATLSVSARVHVDLAREIVDTAPPPPVNRSLDVIQVEGSSSFKFVEVFDTMWELCISGDIKNRDQGWATWIGVMNGMKTLTDVGEYSDQNEALAVYHSYGKMQNRVKQFLDDLLDYVHQYKEHTKASQISIEVAKMCERGAYFTKKAHDKNQFVLGIQAEKGAGQQNPKLREALRVYEEQADAKKAIAVASGLAAAVAKSSAQEAFWLMWDALKSHE